MEGNVGKIYQFKSRKEAENRKFIKDLQERVRSSKPAYDLVKVKYTQDYTEIFDRWGRPIELVVTPNMSYFDMNNGDILFMNLLEIAPRRVEIIECCDPILEKTIAIVFNKPR